ncbi:hypothetical protein KTT_09060 [Tengunoibacter tsumagoiensis]|uniref:Uncharacterized protein n=1 Tax=Tengunoibacter tsumagoiensis TaxID=2014871 RepID=A0A401ZW22_9CHLR|nr:hypothetical protein KTT_09060 [Tengunoibacter tsumagoiensis]
MFGSVNALCGTCFEALVDPVFQPLPILMNVEKDLLQEIFCGCFISYTAVNTVVKQGIERFPRHGNSCLCPGKRYKAISLGEAEASLNNGSLEASGNILEERS